MPAADLHTLFAFEPQIEGAVATVLTAAGATAHRQRSTSSLHTPYVLVQLRMGAPTGHRRVVPGAQVSPADTYPAAWHAHLVLTVVTNRSSAPGNADLHDELVGKVRVAMLQAQGSINTALSYLSVQSVNDAGLIHEIKAEDKLDMSPLVFAIRFVIRHDAWPVAIDE